VTAPLRRGCRIKPFEKTRSTLAEVQFRAAVHDVLATNRLRATDEMAVFGTHPYKRPACSPGVFPTATGRSENAGPADLATRLSVTSTCAGMRKQPLVGERGDVHSWLSGQPHDRNLAIGLLLVFAIARSDLRDTGERLSPLLPLQ
jgi:hypothetical protein